MPDSPFRSYAVLGGGIAGLAAAHRLTALGHRVRLFEQSGRVGGAIRTELTDGWLAEAGPNSLQESSADMAGWWRDLGLEGERVEASPLAKNRYLVRRGRLVPVPMSPPAFFATPLFSPWAKIRLIGEIFARRRERPEEVSLAEFLRDHFGREIVDYAVQPMISGIYAGDPARLSAREVFPQLWDMEQTHGSILRGQIAAAKAKRAQGKTSISKIISFRRGLQAFPDALAARLPPGTLALDHRIERLVPTRAEGPVPSPAPTKIEGPTPCNAWQVAGRNPAGEFTEKFDGVVATMPSGALSRLVIGRAGERPLALLAAVPHPAVSSLFLGYRRDQVSHPLDGFGALVPAVEKRSVIGILFSSSLFPGRAPEGHVALTVMIGGMLQSDLARRPLGELLALAQGDLRDLLGIKGDPVFVRHNFWPQAIPQYELGHRRFREAIAASEQAHPGLFVGGQVGDGISVSQCYAAGQALAERAAR